MVLETLCALGIALQFSAPQAQTELIASSVGVQPGKPFRIAMHMTMAPGWHSYYINPGESGAATSIVWHLPPGFKAGPIQWPVPTRLVVGGVAGYVYEKEVWLITEITPASAIPNDEPVRIGADVSWLLCREACVPQKYKLSLSLPLTRTFSPNPAYERISEIQSKASPTLRIKASIEKNAAFLAVTGRFSALEDVRFFPADATYFGADLSQVRSTPTGINLVVPLSKYAPGAPKRVAGILVVPSGSEKGAHWIDVAVTKR